jgi:hypothetical protein
MAETIRDGAILKEHTKTFMSFSENVEKYGGVEV